MTLYLFRYMIRCVDQYLTPTYFIDFQEASLGLFAREALRKEMDDRAKAVSLFYAVRDSIRYNPWVEAWIRPTNKASRVVAAREGFCVQKASVLVACLRLAGIPARLGLVDIRNHLLAGDLLDAMGTNVFSCHGYAEVYLGGRWIKATPAFNRRLCEKNSFFTVEFDGIHDAVLPDKDTKGRRHIEYLDYYGTFADFPYEFIMEKWAASYPALKVLVEKNMGGQPCPVN